MNKEFDCCQECDENRPKRSNTEKVVRDKKIDPKIPLCLQDVWFGDFSKSITEKK